MFLEEGMMTGRDMLTFQPKKKGASEVLSEMPCQCMSNAIYLLDRSAMLSSLEHP